MSIIVNTLTGGSNSHETTSEEANGFSTDFIAEGIVGSIGNTSGVAPATGGFAVNATGTPDTNIQISAGIAYVTGTPTSQNSQTFRVKSYATTSLAISANSSGSTKYDWIYIKLDATNLNTPNTAGDNVATIVASRSSSASADDGTPPTYGYPIAVVTVSNGFSTITNSNIRDIRAVASLNTGLSSSSDGWTSFSGLATVSVSSGYNKGNKEYDLTFSSTMASILSPGMRIKLTRGTTPPTQCADLELSSSHYASKTSPSGITFTDDFTCEAWVKLESYGGGSDMVIVGRRNASTEGWQFAISATTGQLYIQSLRIAANNRSVISTESIPLGRWIHVAATMDNSANTHTMYINGVAVATTTTTNGTITALVQGTTAMTIGAQNTPGSYFDGKVADVRVWNAVRTATQIRDNMNQQLVGNETNLVAYYKLNGDFNDSTSNANNMTGQNGAVATSSDNPMNSTEYAIVTKVDTTTVTVFTGRDYNIPNMTLSTPYYSTHRVPFDFPADRNNWRITTYSVDASTGVTSGSRIPGLDTSLPVGKWIVSAQASAQAIRTTSTGINLAMGISTSTSTITEVESIGLDYGGASAQPIGCALPDTHPIELNITTQTVYYVTQIGTYTSLTLGTVHGSGHRFIAECAYV